MADGQRMRLDRFLWWARLAKTRSAAQAIAADGRLRIDGRAVDRAHAAVRVGNVLTYAAGARVRGIRVGALPARRGPAAEAQGCYDELTPGPAPNVGTNAGPSRANVSQQTPGD
ncbi:RNA-binding S4 domain-containing protein [Sphingomonas sp.]|uniref:RNA-binding S4 domain-containing protein n=1 Tax=Sphingomonas sp. TaxID=28214 RepID=UPI003CC5A1C0